VDNEILDYKDLAAIPKVKAIYDIERPDLITYEPFYTSGYDDKQERQSLGESPRTLSPTPSAEVSAIVEHYNGWDLGVIWTFPRLEFLKKDI